MALQPGLARQLADDVRNPGSLSAASLTGWRDAYRQLRFVQRKLEIDGGGPIAWKIGTEVHYAPYQEFGTSMFPPQPYLEPAFRRVTGNPAKHTRGAADFEEYMQKLAYSIETMAKDFAPVDTGNLMGSIEAVRVK